MCQISPKEAFPISFVPTPFFAFSLRNGSVYRPKFRDKLTRSDLLFSGKSFSAQDSKSFCLEIGTWVRIPPSPPENGDKSMFLACRHLFICLPPRGFLTGSPPSLGQFPGQCQGLLHGRGAELFGLRIQVSVDVGCGGDVTVAQPFLNLLHGHSLFQQQAGTGVPLRYNNDKRKKP